MVSHHEGSCHKGLSYYYMLCLQDRQTLNLADSQEVRSKPHTHGSLGFAHFLRKMVDGLSFSAIWCLQMGVKGDIRPSIGCDWARAVGSSRWCMNLICSIN